MESKLVRDCVPELILAAGRIPQTRRLSKRIGSRFLRRKLVEEALEALASNRRETPGELGDILDVIEALCAIERIDKKALDLLRKSKSERSGGFRKLVVLVDDQKTPTLGPSSWRWVPSSSRVSDDSRGA